MAVEFAAGYKIISAAAVVHDPSSPNHLKNAHYALETFVFYCTDPNSKLFPELNARVPEVAPRPLIRAVMPASTPCAITLLWPIQRFMPW